MATVTEGGGWTSEGGKILPTGEFVFEELPPGKHRLHLLGQGGNGAHTVGQTEVNLTDQDATGVVITPFQPAQVHARMVQEGEEDKPLTVGGVFLKPADGLEDSRGTPFQFQPQNGKYSFPSVIPGRYQIWFNNTSHSYLKSVQAEGRMLDTNLIEVAEGSSLDLLLAAA
jgi:hypothetical protein